MDITANRSTAHLSAERAAELTSARAAIGAATDAHARPGAGAAGCRLLAAGRVGPRHSAARAPGVGTWGAGGFRAGGGVAGG